MTQNALTTIDNQAGQFLQKFGKSLEQYAIRKYDKNAFLKSAMLAIVSNENLAKCLETDQGKLSLFAAMRHASTTGLSLNPDEGKAALIPYGNQIRYQPMKNGLIELALQSGKIEYLISDNVRTNDDFGIIKTSDGDKFQFQPALEDRGGIRGFFAAIKFKDGSCYVKWMTKDEIEKIRDEYSQYVYYAYDDKNKKFKKGDPIPHAPWNKSFIGMGEKTVMRRLLSSISISEDTDKFIAANDFYEADYVINDPGTTADQAAEKLKAKEEQPKTQAVESDESLL